MQATTKRVTPPIDTGLTERRDTWWLEPLLTMLGLGTFVVYSLWVAFQGKNYETGPYLSPFYSPLLRPDWWSFSPAVLILWIPLGFRLTCYYYRKAYYRTFFWDPPACAVGELRKGYQGERRFPFVLQNVHRYFFYLALIVVAFLWYDAVKGFIFEDGFGIGIGSLVLLVNVGLLTLYSGSCHYLRHVSGGCSDCLASQPTRYRLWRVVSLLNLHHMLWAWLSLSSVALADLYVRLVASGVITDLRIL